MSWIPSSIMSRAPPYSSPTHTSCINIMSPHGRTDSRPARVHPDSIDMLAGHECHRECSRAHKLEGHLIIPSRACDDSHDPIRRLTARAEAPPHAEAQRRPRAQSARTQSHTASRPGIRCAAAPRTRQNCLQGLPRPSACSIDNPEAGISWTKRTEGMASPRKAAL